MRKNALLFFSVILIFNCCKKDCLDPENPECGNYDPCLKTFPTNAAFGFWNKNIGGDVYLPYRDTIPGGNIRVYFRATDPRMSAYEWRVGADPRVFTDSVFSLVFTNIFGWVNVSLTAYHEQADQVCFPGDTGKITTERAFYLNPDVAETQEEYLEQYPIFGAYLGHDEGSPQDTFRMTIAWPHDLGPTIYNFPEGCSKITNGVFYNTHYLYLTANRSDCKNPTVYAVLQEDNRSILIDYSIEENGQRIQKKWIGVKLTE